MKLPETVMIAGVPHKVEYCTRASEVDINKRESLWGQIDFWTKTIRIYTKDNPYAAIFKVLLHEMIHGYGAEWDIKDLNPESEDTETKTDLLANLFFDLFISNPWLINSMEELYDEKSHCPDLSL